MKRTPMKRGPRARKSAALKGLRAGKRLGKSTRPKDAWKSRAHTDRVRAFGCLMNSVVCGGRVDPHHCRKLRGMRGNKLPRDDRFVVPLCRNHHDQITFAKYEEEHEVWKRWRIDPAAWIASFSEEGRAAIEALSKDRGEAVPLVSN